MKPVRSAILSNLAISITTVVVSGPAIAIAVPQPGGSARQTANTGSARTVAGEVTEVDSKGTRIRVKTEAGQVITVVLANGAELLRIPPGETTLEKAVRIEPTAVSIGDKAYARGVEGADGASIAARRMILISKAEIEQRQEHDRAEWQRRGIAGVITALDPAARTISVRVRVAGGTQSFLVEPLETTLFRRYRPDSVKFSDAKPSSFAELRVGDQIRVLGDRAKDGARIAAEQVVSGAFKTVGGTVTEVRPDAGELKIAMLGSKQPLTIVMNDDSVIKRLTQEVAVIIAQAGKAAQKPVGGAAGQPAGDLREVVESLPALTVSQIKPGSVIAVSSTVGTDPSRLTAITLITGVEEVLKLMGKPGRAAPIVVSTGLPAGVLDFLTDQP